MSKTNQNPHAAPQGQWVNAQSQFSNQNPQMQMQMQNESLASSGPMFPMISATSHPILSLVHIILKIVVVVVYIVFPIFSSSFFVKEIVIILAAIDFWIVKNIIGRMLVGLRWGVDFDENGDEQWKFACKVNENSVNSADDKVFWGTLIVFTLAWLVLSIANVISLNITNAVITLFCLVLIGFNLYSYYRCSKAQKQSLQKLIRQKGMDVAMQFMAGGFRSTYF